jgi:hypothetical protein
MPGLSSITPGECWTQLAILLVKLRLAVDEWTPDLLTA